MLRNVFIGLPVESYKLVAVRELHIGIPGYGNGWYTSTFARNTQDFRYLKSNHRYVRMFQTFGIITSAFLCRTIRDMQVN